MTDSQPVHEWVYVLVILIPALCTLIGVVYQARKTRARGTDEHLMAREMLLQHGEKLDRIDGKVDRIDTKVDRVVVRVDVLEDKAHNERATILSAVEDHPQGA